MKVHLDIETRSRADLPSVGAYRYGCDPSTQIMMAAVSEEQHDAPVYLWVNPLFRDAGVASDPEALELLAQADEVRAFNAPFEQPVMHGKSFRPFVSLEKFRCTQAMARMAGLPESLEKCGEALSIDCKKDGKGKSLIWHFSIPRDEDGQFNAPQDHPEKWAQFCEYCRQDVRAEKEIHRRLRGAFNLEGVNLETFQYTMRMNALGIPVNVRALQNAQKIIQTVESKARIEFNAITGLNITQRQKVLEWLLARGVNIPNMQAETLESVILEMQPENVARVIELYQQLSYAAVKKIGTMLDWTMPDGRMRGVMKFYGTNTGRWSAGGPQIQNAKKPSPQMRPITAPAYQYIADGGTVEGLDALYGDPLEVIASCIRHFVHEPGRQMLDADYNAIEARIACWVAGETAALDAYRKGADRYKQMAAVIFNVPANAVTSDQRTLGKVAILGLGYGMGSQKFHKTCTEMYGMDISVELAEQATGAFREMHPKIRSLWGEMDAKIRNAINKPNESFNVGTGNLRIFCRAYPGNGLYLHLMLPSGRLLSYPDPKVTQNQETGNLEITYHGQLTGTTAWGRIKLYGAKAFENVCQAIAADLMSFGARKAEAEGMAPFALIHDQALAIQSGGHTPDQFASALHQLPSWAVGLPLKAEAKLTPYYSK